MTEQELTLFLGQKLTEIATAMMVYYDCCHIQGTTCRAGDPNPCCHNTIFGKGLCPFSQDWECLYPNPACKLWICKTAINATDPKCVEALKLLEQVGALYGLVGRPFIGHPYSGADRQVI